MHRHVEGHTLHGFDIPCAGATNRIDALDGALRRPGRFDRELVFPLPNLAARAAILRIHTRHWARPPLEGLLRQLAQLCVGYCGADLKVGRAGHAPIRIPSPWVLPLLAMIWAFKLLGPSRHHNRMSTAKSRTFCFYYGFAHGHALLDTT